MGEALNYMESGGTMQAVSGVEWGTGSGHNPKCPPEPTSSHYGSTTRYGSMDSALVLDLSIGNIAAHKGGASERTA